MSDWIANMPHVTPPSEPDGSRVPKACLPCARAKVKCGIEAGDDICTRCRRLKKVCSVQTAGAHRRALGHKSEVSRLEQKLDGVAAILSASQRFAGGNDLERQLLLSEPATLTPAACIDHFIKSDSEAEAILRIFRNNMTPHFPFVAVPPNLTFQELRKTKPFLSLPILMIGCRHDSPRQVAIARKIRELISYNLLIKGERNLDILQGLVLFLGWYYLHVNLGSQLSNLMHLAMAMMTDLGLNKAAHPRNFTKPSPSTMGYFGRYGQDFGWKAPSLAGVFADRSPSSERTLEERRAYLGCFYLSSLISMCNRDIEPIRYSSYADECCRTLSAASEYTTDAYLIQLTHLHCLADKISRSLARDEWDLTSSTISAPVGACVRSMELELSHLKTSLVPQGPTFLIHYYAIEAFLYEVALNDSINPERYGSYHFSRLNMLFACLDSTKSCLNTFFNLPLSTWFDIPFTIWSLMGHMMVLSSKLCLFTGEGWDHQYVQSVLNFSDVVDSLVQKLEEAKALTGISVQQTSDGLDTLPQGYTEPLSSLVPKLQHIKRAHETKYAARMGGGAEQHLEDFSNVNSGMTSADMSEFVLPPATGLFEFLDDSFWQQLA